ncbi:substrate-binding periplasmic protein [Pseudomonas anguilliseptica]|uniref:Amino acid ABC transporter substrate-binding protein, PAAT family n=1 Tax=Pseudomonas anguilliseptica TaxID=53406 RepID=A0A1H5CCF1_PSEAG|nr:ABC transporter substrate-binding protein [Pseudomonas anguilliseptica]SED64211.1 amino acid ABC transporter substrate-binding protein, PAAT family [Pseudomonas anguilliseptica]
MAVVVTWLRCAVLCAGLVLFLGVQAQAEQLVRIGTGDWSPYVEQQRADAGPLGRLISAVFRRAGYRVEYHYYPWVRGVHLLKTGQLDVLMPYICNPERQQFSLCSAPLLRSEAVVFHLRDKAFSWQQFRDFEAYTIALTKGYSYGPGFDAARQSLALNIQESSKEDVGMRLLLAGRVDVHLQDRAVGYAMLRRLFTAEEQQRIVHDPKPVSREQLGLLFRKNASGEQLRQAFDAALRPLQENGELQRLQEMLERGEAAAWEPRL